LIAIKTLPHVHAHDLGDAQRIELLMTAEDRRRVRRRVEAPDGQILALELATGTTLRPGQVLLVRDGRAYVVSAAPEDVLVVQPRNLAEAAAVGHLIGNLHRDIDLTGDEIATLWESGLEDRLRRAGVAVERQVRPFLGKAGEGHQH
jgi:urease accessory protein